MFTQGVGRGSWRGRKTLSRLGLASVVTLLAFLPAAAGAQPFGGYLVLDSDEGDYIEIPDSPALNPTAAITLEGWVRFDVDAIGSCGLVLIGKHFFEGYSVSASFLPDVCSSFRSWLGGSPRDGGVFTPAVWTHWAVTSDGVTRRHYLNGIQVGEFAETGPLTSNTAPVRIGSDVAPGGGFPPRAALDEFRLWNVARTQAQIQSTMNTAITTPRAGLVAVWSLDGDGSDALGDHHGVVVGDPAFVGGAPEPEPPPGPWLTTLDQPDFRFKVRITAGDTQFPGTQVDLCIVETLCAAGALAGRPEVFVKIIGPRPNGFLWVLISRFTPSRVEVWVEQLSSDQVNYYTLAQVAADETDISGLQDREAFLP